MKRNNNHLLKENFQSLKVNKQKHLTSTRNSSNFIGMFLLHLKKRNEKSTFNVVKFSGGNFGKGKILIAYRLKDGRCNLMQFKMSKI